MKLSRHWFPGLLALLLLTAPARSQVKKIQMKIAGHLCSMCAYNIGKAVNALEFGPTIEELKVVNLSKGLAEFTPKPDRPVSLAVLRSALKSTGYKLLSAEITVSGTLAQDDNGWWLETEPSKQRFRIAPDRTRNNMPSAQSKSVEITGDWQTDPKGKSTSEVIVPRPAKISAVRVEDGSELFDIRDIQASLTGASRPRRVSASVTQTQDADLGIYKGVVFEPRYSFTRQHLGDLKVDHQTVVMGMAYTPTPSLQVGINIPYHHFSQAETSGHNVGDGDVWVKYRFYNSPVTGGERRAAVKIGVEFPLVGKGVFESVLSPNDESGTSEFVRRQLLQINGAGAVRVATFYSGAIRRFIYAADIEGIARSQFDGFRMGHEIRANTNLRFVVLPLQYDSPRQELRLGFQSNYRYIGLGRLDGNSVPGSTSSEFFLTPELSYIVSPRLVLEASYQVPVVRNTGPQVFRTDGSVMLGVRFSY